MLITAGITALISAVVLGIALAVHRSGRPFLPEDPPDTGRKNHPHPIPMSGFLIGSLLTIAFAIGDGWALSVATACATATGFIDDWTKARRIELDWRWKALGLSVATGFAIVAADTGHGVFTSALFIFVVINAFNFLDNQNGVTAGLAAVSGALMLNGALWEAEELTRLSAAAVLLGASTAFLIWNWPRARLFLGDGGAYPLGLTAAVLALRSGDRALDSTADTHWWAASLFVAVPLLDFTQVVIARLYIGQAPWVGDRRHLTHIALNAGVPRSLVAPLFWLLALAIPLVAVHVL